MEAEAGDETAPEILALEPEPSLDAADGADGDTPLPEGLAGALWPDAGGGAQADLPEWEQSPFPDPGGALGRNRVRGRWHVHARGRLGGWSGG